MNKIQAQKQLYTLFLQFLPFSQQLQLSALCKRSQKQTENTIYVHEKKSIDWNESKYTMQNGNIKLRLFDRRDITVRVVKICGLTTDSLQYVIDNGRNFGIKLIDSRKYPVHMNVNGKPMRVPRHIRPNANALAELDIVLSKLVRDVDLSSMGLTSIPYGARFIESGLDLSRNNIEVIENIDKLRHGLNLSNNELTTMIGLENMISGVNLDQNDDITKISNLDNLVSDLSISCTQVTVIDSLPNLQSGLTADNCQITAIKCTGIPKLTRKVSLRQCDLTSTVGLERITDHLDLSFNKLTSEALSNLNCIKGQLNVCDNLITKIPQNIAKQVVYNLNLRDNPIKDKNTTRIDFACISNLDLDDVTGLENTDFPHLVHGLQFSHWSKRKTLTNRAPILKTGENEINRLQLCKSVDLESLIIPFGTVTSELVQLNKLRILNISNSDELLMNAINTNHFPCLDSVTIRVLNGTLNGYNVQTINCTANLTNLSILIGQTVVSKLVLNLTAMTTKHIKMTYAYVKCQLQKINTYNIIGGTESVLVSIGTRKPSYIEHYGQKIDLTLKSQHDSNHIIINQTHTYNTIHVSNCTKTTIQILGNCSNLSLFHCTKIRVIANRLQSLHALNTRFNEVSLENLSNAYLEDCQFKFPPILNNIQRFIGKNVSFQSLKQVKHLMNPFGPHLMSTITNFDVNGTQCTDKLYIKHIKHVDASSTNGGTHYLDFRYI